MAPVPIIAMAMGFAWVETLVGVMKATEVVPQIAPSSNVRVERRGLINRRHLTRHTLQWNVPTRASVTGRQENVNALMASQEPRANAPCVPMIALVEETA